MKKLSITILIFLSLFTLTFRARAQAPATGYKITGSVSDSVSKKNLDFITINVMIEKVAVKADYTKADGSFAFTGLKPGRYMLLIAGVGYKNKAVPADLTDTTKLTLELGDILIREDAIGLNEIKITATKQIIKQEADRISYDLQADPESKVFNVLDMMRKVPYLSLDADENIQLKGNSDFKILINGKPSSMMERSYKDVLRSMPASSIQRIEVITTPPSQYDAEGLAGIINIITNKNVDNGYNGSVNISERVPVGGPGMGGSFSAKIGKWGLSGFGGANVYNTPEINTSGDRLTFGETSTSLNQNGFNRSSSNNGYLGLELSYEIDSLNLVSAQFNINGNKSDGSGTQNSSLSGGNEVLQKYRLNSSTTGNGNGMDVALNYQLGFKADKNRMLTFSYRYFGFGNGQNNSTDVSERVNYDVPDYRQVNNATFSEQTIQLDYVHPFRKLTVEAGVKGIKRDNRSNFEYQSYNSDSDQFEIFDDLTNRFSNIQNVYGIYNSYQYNLRQWSFKGGIRVEQTIMKADFVSTNSTVKQNYFNTIPSFSVNRKLENGSGINIGFSQRIRRPGIYQLNPFIDKSNPSYERTGNPNLRPSIANQITMGYSRPGKVTLNINVGVEENKDIIFPVAVYDSASKITRSSFGNVGFARIMPLVNINANFPITKRWNMNLNSRGGFAKTYGVIDNTMLETKGFMFGLNASSSYRFEKGWRVNANLNANSRNFSIQSRGNGMIASSFSVNKDVIKDKLSFSASCNNPFNKYRVDRRETFGGNFTQTNDRRDYFRSFNISMNYKFGKLKESIRKNKRGIRNDDVQGGDS